MKKATQYSDKYGKVVAEGEVVEERVEPGVFLTPQADVVVEEVVEDVVEDEVEAEEVEYDE